MLYKMAESLKSNLIELGEAIWELEHCEEMLRWFSCDCAERSLDREKRAGQKLDQRSLDAVFFARKVAAGKGKAKYLKLMRFSAGDAARAAFADGASDAAKSTVEDSARYAAMSASSHAQRAASVDMARVHELRWQQRRLAYLCEVWAICGHRASWMLFENSCPIEPPEEATL